LNIFSARLTIAKGHLSVRLSVTLVSHAQTVQGIEIGLLFTRYDKAVFVVLGQML